MKNDTIILMVVAAGAGLYLWSRQKAPTKSTAGKTLENMLADGWNPFKALNNPWDSVSSLPSPLLQYVPDVFSSSPGVNLTNPDYLYKLSTQPSLDTRSASAEGVGYMTKKWETPKTGDTVNGERVVWDGLKYESQFRGAELKYGLPEGVMSRLAWQESRYNPKAISPVGARGIVQIMPRTRALFEKAFPGQLAAKTDQDLFDPLKSIPTGAFILSKLKAEITPSAARSWPAAIVAYNQGSPNVNKAIAAKGPVPTDWIEWFKETAKPDGYGYFQIATDVGLTPAGIGSYRSTGNVAGIVRRKN
jgi:hypothetical protein